MSNSKQRFDDVLRHPENYTIGQLRRVARRLWRGGWLDEARSLARTTDAYSEELRRKP